MTSRDYGDINHAIGFNHINAFTGEVVAFCTCTWVSEPITARAARSAADIHLGEIA